MKLLGIDNVFFEVAELEAAIAFYQKLGFPLKFKIPQLPGALLKIGEEEPGLILHQVAAPKPSKIWIEIENAHLAKDLCEKLHIKGILLETATGLTYEIEDPWKNKLGFADYSKKPGLARC